MKEIFHIFFLNFITNIDNAFVIGTIIKRSFYTRWEIIVWSAIALTLSRTAFILIAKNLASIPGLRIIAGFITILIAIRMAKPNTQWRQNTSIFQLLLIIITTDLTISLDSIIAISTISYNIFQIACGVFLSVFCIFLFLPSIQKVFNHIPWIQIFAAGMIAQIAVEEIAKDTLVFKWSNYIRIFLIDGQQLHIIALGIAITVVLFGIANQIKHRFNKFR